MLSNALLFNTFNIFTMFSNMSNDGQKIVTSLGLVLGIILFGYGAISITKAVMSKQARSSNVVLAICALIVGGFIGTSAFSRLKGFGDGAGTQVNQWGGGN